MLHEFSLQTRAIPTIPLPKGEDIFSKHEELFKKGEEEWILKCFYKSVTL
jgi:transcriptional regulator